MKWLAFLALVFVAFSAETARADIVCVAEPAQGECVVSSDGASVRFTRSAADRITAAAAQSTDLQKKVTALISADEARQRQAAALTAMVSDQKAAIASAERGAEARDAQIEATQKALDSERSSLVHSPIFWIGTLTVAALAGALIDRGLSR